MRAFIYTKIKKILIIHWWLVFYLAQSQDFSSNWKSHYAFWRITDLITSEPNRGIAASENALFSFSITPNTTTTITTVNGLSGDLISKIYYSRDQSTIFVGYETGLIEVILPDGEVRKIVAIVQNTAIPPNLKRIQHFFEQGSLLYIATSFGIVAFDTTQLEFRDRFLIGTQGSFQSIFSAAVFGDKIYATTANGLLSASISNTNLIDFKEWQLESAGVFTQLVLFKDRLLVQQGDNIIGSVTANGITNTITTAASIQQITASENLVVTLQDRVEIYDDDLNRIRSLVVPKSNQLRGAIQLGEDFFVGTQDLGLIQINSQNDQAIQRTPNGPSQNSPFRLAAFGDELWVVYGKYSVSYNPFPLQRKDISILKANTWETIPNTAFNGISSLCYINGNPKNNNQVFVSSFQEGLLVFENRELVAHYNATNSALESLSQSSDIVRVNGSVWDPEGNLWIVNSRTTNGLNKFSPNSNAFTTQVNTSTVVPSTLRDLGYSDLVINQLGQLFAGTFVNGLIAYDPNTQRLTKLVNSLPDAAVDALAIDNDDQLWIGTRKGVRVANTSSAILNQANPIADPIIIVDEDQVPQELLFDQYITDIAVDGNNNKWIGTESAGVFHLSADGQQTLAHFTKDNTPLPDNGILDIAIDNDTGSVFFATKKGLLEYKGTAIAASETLDDLHVFPNPVRPNYTGNVTIKGLTRNANVKITDVAGNLVYEQRSLGGSTIWDTTAFGKYKVATGVYLVLVTGENQSQSAVHKLLIVR